MSDQNIIRFKHTLKNGFGWLSNFYMHDIVIDGIVYKSVEHFFQASKFKQHPAAFDAIRSAAFPSIARAMGRTYRMSTQESKEWDRERDAVMMRGLRTKFSDPTLKDKLLETGDSVLIEDGRADHWCGQNGRLGKMLMQIRAEIRSEPASDAFVA